MTLNLTKYPVSWLLLLVVFLNYASTCNGYTPTLVKDLTDAIRGPYQTVNSKAVSPKCTAAFRKLISNVSLAVAAADAIGKPAAGLLEGNLAWIGHFDECTNITGLNYCTVQMQLNATKIIQKLVLPISWGVCVPQECNNADVNNAIEFIADMANISGYFHVKELQGASTVCARDPPTSYGAGFITTVIIILVALLGSLYETIPKVKRQSFTSPALRLEDDVVIKVTHNVDNDGDLLVDVNEGQIINGAIAADILPLSRNIILRTIQCFSLTDNLGKLMDSKQSDRSITCLNGIRVISMFWVILGHTFIFSAYIGALENPIVGLSFTTRFGFQAIANAFFSVDTFFFLSGFLVAFLTLSRMAKTNGKIPWFWFYFHRFWRLTPVYMFTILIYMYLAPHFGHGPFWQNAVGRPFCPKYWWTNLLYINNFWPKNFGEECIAWSWYLANDMQFFVISPIFLITLYMVPAVGVALVGCALSASFIATGSIIGYYNLYVGILLQPPPGSRPPPMDFSSLVYGKPYCRIAPYLVGTLLGYAMYKIGNKKVRMNPVIASLGWAVASGLGIAVVYGLYPNNKDPANHPLSQAANIIYGTFSRFVWALALAWVVFACKYGYGGWVNDFLSWNGWIVLSRLTYTAYLVHPIVIMIFYFNFGTAIHYSLVLLSFYFVGCLGISYGTAAIFSLAIEYPFANLEKLFMPRDIQSKRTVDESTKNSAIHS